MGRTAHSEYGKIELLYLKNLDLAWKSQEVVENEWKVLNYLFEPSFEEAQIEYDRFKAILTPRVGQIRYFEEGEHVGMDSVFCRDASVVTDAGVILSNMGKEARRREPQKQGLTYEKFGMKVLGCIESPGLLEGGDVAWLDEKTIAVGLGYRTNQPGIDQLSQFLTPLGVRVISVDLPHYKGPSDVFHLMSILSPLDRRLAVVYSPLMPVRFRNELIDLGFEFVEVPESEFDTLGCNVLALGPRISLIPKGNPVTSERLLSAGCEVIEYSAKNISLAGGGGPTCLTRPLVREI